ncbi:hypothetical protein SEUCBS139899_009166 [Sporothrix eucalyptigena]|uniref:Uncharacterized protein n=1 Tax=Sporothrix eucalyptigena TaxID=1812306 RepID=A0ABP0CBB6_9PEZI
MMGRFGKPSSSNLRNNSITGVQSVDQLTNRVQQLEMRVRELSQQLDEQTNRSEVLQTEVNRLEQAKADHQIRHAMRVSDLEHRIMVMKQQLWVATNSEESTSPSTARPVSVSSTSIPSSAAPSGRSISPQSRASASLEAERTRRGELESQVAVLRTQLNDERRRQATRDREHRTQTAQLTEKLTKKDLDITSKEADLRRIAALLTDQSNVSLQRTSRLERQVAEEAARRQQVVDSHEAQKAAQARELEELRLQKNIESGQRMAAERRVQHLREEVARRGQQLEYFQQRLLRTAEFRVVKTPFEQEEKEAVVAEAASLSTPPSSPPPVTVAEVSAAAEASTSPAADSPLIPTIVTSPTSEPVEICS